MENHTVDNDFFANVKLVISRKNIGDKLKAVAGSKDMFIGVLALCLMVNITPTDNYWVNVNDTKITTADVYQFLKMKFPGTNQNNADTPQKAIAKAALDYFVKYKNFENLIKSSHPQVVAKVISADDVFTSLQGSEANDKFSPEACMKLMLEN